MRESIFKWLMVFLFALPGMSQSSICQTTYVDQLSLLNGKKKAVIPFRYVHNFIILDVKLYGIVPAQFIFDTGAEHVILFKREYTDMLNIPYDNRVPILGSDMSREIWALIMRNIVVEVDGLRPKPYDILVLEEDLFNLDEMIGLPVSGLIGGGFFKNMIVNIDYRKQRITLYDPAYFQVPKDFHSIPIHIKSNKPYANGVATLMDGTKVNLELLIDTGSGVPMLLHNNSHASLHLPDQFIKGKLGMGLGGYLEGHIGRIRRLDMRDISYSSVLVSFQDVDTSFLQDENRFRNGILGNEFLSRFNAYFDYPGGHLFLKPYKSKPRPFTMDRSGLVIFAYGPDFRQFVVKDILPDSPAQKAGFQANDIILKINGASSNLFSLDGINRILQKRPGKKIRVKVLRGKEEIRIKLVLDDLI